MPVYPAIKSSQVEKNEVINTRMNSYLLKTRTSDSSTLLYIGGVDTYCIECQIEPTSPIGLLSKIEYDEKCSLSGRYERGTDTITIITLMLEHIQQNYPYVKQLTFDDYSYRECAPGIYIDLAYFYYALYGETWYMKKMGAYFMSEADRSAFENLHTAFQKSKETTSWALYDRYATTEHPLPVEQMQKLYTETSTWTTFFTMVRDAVGDIGVLCAYMQPWITTFIKEHAKLRFTSYTFAMDVPNPVLSTIMYEISPYVKGGRRRTRSVSRKKRAIDLR
jgi:hypothetical protein